VSWPKAQVWNRSQARAQLLGPEPTMNPTPAASSILKRYLGVRGFRQAVRSQQRRRKSFHKDNPLPAAVALLGGLGGLGKRFQSRAARDAQRKANTDAQAAAVLAAPAGSPLQKLALERMAAQTYATKVGNTYHQLKLAETIAAVTTAAQETAATAAKETAAERRRAAAAAKAESAASTAQFLGVTERLGGAAFSALAQRGRSLPRPKRRRTTRSRRR
jgi:hypothetical protein